MNVSNISSCYSIKDLENLSGIKAHTLRIWEQRYSFISPKRTETNIRYYDNTDLRLVLNISLLKEHGFKISAIAQMTSAEMCQQVISLTDKALRFPDQVQALTISMLDMDEERFEKIMNSNILKFGFEEAMTLIIYPFLGKVGTLWMTGAITPAQEHFITYLIRQKVIVATDAQIRRQKPNAKKYLLYLPDGELHEISLLFANYLIRSRGHRTIYLGQSLPYDDLRSVVDAHQPDYIFTVITASPGPDEVQAYIHKLAKTFSNATIMMSGFQVVGQHIEKPSNVIVFKQIDQFIASIDAI
jgi:DNA-binding transcriptional MerR regulator